MVTNEKIDLYDKFMRSKEGRDLKKERYENLVNDTDNIVYVNGARVDKKEAKKLLLG